MGLRSKSDHDLGSNVPNYYLSKSRKFYQFPYFKYKKYNKKTFVLPKSGTNHLKD